MSTSVSVVMAVYNGRRFLPQQLTSVLSQLEMGDELIVIDDASSDESFNWLASVVDNRLRLYSNPQNLGVLKSFEHGLLLAQNPILFLCDQDDVWLPSKRSTFVAAFEGDQRIMIVISDAELIDSNGIVTAPSFMATRGGFRGSVWSTLIKNRYLGCAMAFRKELLALAMPVPPSVPMHDMWFGALGSAVGKVAYIDAPLMQYRRHGGNVSPGKSQGWLRMLRWRVTLITLLTNRLFAWSIRRH